MKILIVEDEQAIADTLIYVLKNEGFWVTHVLLGGEAFTLLQKEPFDLLILDVGLPDTTGFEVLKSLRKNENMQHIPVIFLTARNEEIDRILGLELGADDYVAKPFSPREVASRVRAVLRRSEPKSAPKNTPKNEYENALQNEPKNTALWQHDKDALRIRFCGQLLDLTRYEYRLLALFLSHPERVFTREIIMNSVWADALDTADRSVDTHIKTLRAKLRAICADEVIMTHRGLGYSLLEKLTK